MKSSLYFYHVGNKEPIYSTGYLNGDSCVTTLGARKTPQRRDIYGRISFGHIGSHLVRAGFCALQVGPW
jgi:hypothetical protein